MRFRRSDRTFTGFFAGRDASWYARPNVDSVKMLHALQADGGSACGIAILDDETAMPASTLKASRICRRPACMNAWIHQTGVSEGAK